MVKLVLLSHWGVEDVVVVWREEEAVRGNRGKREGFASPEDGAAAAESSAGDGGFCSI